MRIPAWLQLKPMEETTPPHTHAWNLLFSTYAAPYRQVGMVSGDTQDSDTFLKALLGTTTLLSECSCGERRQDILLGSQNPELDDVLDRVLIYGPQYMQRDGVTFTFQRFVPQPQPVTGVPIR